jgi:hypothetical protein
MWEAGFFCVGYVCVCVWGGGFYGYYGQNLINNKIDIKTYNHPHRHNARSTNLSHDYESAQLLCTFYYRSETESPAPAHLL